MVELLHHLYLFHSAVDLLFPKYFFDVQFVPDALDPNHKDTPIHTTFTSISCIDGVGDFVVVPNVFVANWRSSYLAEIDIFVPLRPGRYLGFFRYDFRMFGEHLIMVSGVFGDLVSGFRIVVHEL